jgi:hypothetical protein
LVGHRNAEVKVSSRSFLAVTLLLAMGGTQTRFVRAQGRVASCAVSPILVDSARDEVLSVLTSQSLVIREMRQDLGIVRMEEFSPVTVIRDGAACSRAASNFDHQLDAGASVVLLRLGKVLYARDPDQRRGTGIIMDSTFKVLVRLGAAIP